MAKTSYLLIKDIKCEHERKARQLDFLRRCKESYDYLCRRDLKDSWQHATEQLHLLHVWYNYGFEKGWLTITFQFFFNIIKGSQSHVDIYPEKPRKRRRYSWHGHAYWRSRYGEYRVGKKYRKNTEHKKKEIDETAERKKEWREKKGFREDGFRKPHYRRGPGKWHKQNRASAYRSWVAEQTSRDNWDAFHTNDHWEYQGRSNSYDWS